MSIIAGKQQVGDSHPNALTYGIDSHRPESASHLRCESPYFHHC